MKKRVFFSLVLSSFLLGCGGGDSSSSKGTANAPVDSGENIVIANIFPAQPQVTLKGRVKLTPVVTDKYKSSIVSSTPTSPINIEWSSKDSSIADVNIINREIILVGKSIGKTTITADVYDKNGFKKDSYTIDVSVVNTMSNIAEIHLSPDRASIHKDGGSKSFDITAVDMTGVPAALNPHSIKFDYSNPLHTEKYIINDPNSDDLTDYELKVTTADNQIGYVFITPKYTTIGINEEINSTITGNPIVVEVHNTPPAQPPQNQNFNAGKYLDLAVNKKDGKIILYVVHYDKANGDLRYSEFNNGSWSRSTLPDTTNSNAGIDSKIVLSSFENNENEPIIVALEDNKIKLWYRENNKWYTDIVEELEDINSTKKDRFLDVALSYDKNLSKNRLYVAYYSQEDSRIYLESSSMAKDYSFDWSNSNRISINTMNIVESLSIDLDKNSEIKLSYIVAEDKNNTKYPENYYGVFYAEIDKNNTSKFIAEKLSGTNGAENGVVLRVDELNRPAILFYTDENHIKFSQKINSKWSNTSNIGENLISVSNIDFQFDYRNTPRVTFNSDDKILYARWIEDKSQWKIENIEEGQGFGEYQSIVVDNENRSHIVYTSSDDLWFKYWAEPLFFDYTGY